VQPIKCCAASGWVLQESFPESRYSPVIAFKVHPLTRQQLVRKRVMFRHDDDTDRTQRCRHASAGGKSRCSGCMTRTFAFATFGVSVRSVNGWMANDKVDGLCALGAQAR